MQTEQIISRPTPRAVTRKPAQKRAAHGLTRSKDGVMRLSAVIPVRLSLADVSVFITSAIYGAVSSDCDDLYIREISTEDLAKSVTKRITSKRKAMEIALEEVRQEGEEKPHYVVGDNNLDALCKVVETHLVELWAAA